INKFQDEIGGHLKGGDPGLLLLKEKSGNNLAYDLPTFEELALTAVSQARIFDSCELSVLSSALAQRADVRVAMMSTATAESYALSDGDLIKVKVGDSVVSLPLVIDSRMPDKLVTIPDDVHTRTDLSSAFLPAACEITRGAYD